MDNKKKSTTEQKFTVAVVIITAFVTTFTGSALNLSIPDIGGEFGVSADFVGWLVTGYTLAVAAFSVPAGRVADVTCRKPVLVAGLIIFIACCIAAVFSMSMIMLLTVRVVQGNRFGYDFQHQYSYSNQCLSRKYEGKGPGIFYSGYLCGPFCRTGFGRLSQS